MKKLQIPSNITRTFHKVGFQLKKHSPEILVVTGVIGTVASAVMACKATTKISGIIENAKTNIDTIHECVEHPELLTEEYTVEDSKKDLAIVYAQTGLEFVKLYGPAVVVGAVSIGCILAGHNITRKRNVALAAAYATVDKGFKDYRNRVIDRFGKDLDRELKHNIKAKEIEETVIDEKGKEKKIKKTVNVVDPNTISPYSVVYDCGCKGWDKDPETNRFFLTQCQNFANDKLRTQGYLFLNDVYEMLGVSKTKAGQVVGWVYDEKHPVGDNFVDFGMYNDVYDERKCAFVNGYETNILLDFNVDGNILDLMK